MIVFTDAPEKLIVLAVGLLLLGCTRQSPTPVVSKGDSSRVDKTAPLVEVAPEETPAGMKETLALARQLWEEVRQLPHAQRYMKLSRTLTSVSSGFAEVPVAFRDEVPQWAKIRVNTAGAGFDAIRFSSPLGGNADLLWAFASSGQGRLVWSISGEGNSFMEGFEDSEPIDLSLQSLREAVQCGFDDYPLIRGDADLDSLRELPAYAGLLKELDDQWQSPFR